MRLLNISIILSMTFISVVYAEHISLKEVEELEKQCKDAQEPYFKMLRERLTIDCQKVEQVNRGDPEICADRYKDIDAVINPPLPICIKADEALKKYNGLEP